MCCQIKIRQGIFLCQILVYDNRKRLWGIYMESWTDINRLNDALKSFRELEQNPELLAKKRSLESQISWLNDIVSRC